MQWSPYQEAVFDFNINGTGNCFVDAKAGSGKSTVIEECIRQLPSDKRVLAVSFNRHIRDALASRLADAACEPDVHTIHSFGLAAYRDWHRASGDSVKVNKWKMINLSKELKIPSKLCRIVQRIVSIMKATNTHGTTDSECQNLMLEYDVNQPKGSSLQEINHHAGCLIDESCRRILEIDFDDMIYMPLLYDCKVPQYDFLYVDEAQDLSTANIELIIKSIATGGRAMFVGDPCQAMYQFRGANAEAVQRIITDFKCRKLPLSISYRCSKAVIREAQAIVPEIECSVDAAEGSVSTVSHDEFKPDHGDYVLCRTNAPLVAYCLKALRDGKRATVKGREIGDTLIEMLKASYDYRGASLKDRLQTYFGERMLALDGRRFKQMELDDNYQMLLAIMDACGRQETDIVESKINRIFSDDDDGIIFSTIHKSKGLEADRVWIVHPELLPHPLGRPEVESNIKYVGVTRARRDLIFVGSNLAETD